MGSGDGEEDDYEVIEEPAYDYPKLYPKYVAYMKAIAANGKAIEIYGYDKFAMWWIDLSPVSRVWFFSRYMKGYYRIMAEEKAAINRDLYGNDES